MLSSFTIAVGLFALYMVSFPYRLALNYMRARKMGLPIIVVPIDHNHFVWMLISVPLRPIFKEYLPESIYERLSLVTYGWEFHHGLEPFRKYSKTGNDKIFFLVTCGRPEISTCDPEIVYEITRRPRDFRQPDTTALILGRFGRNIITENDDEWAKHRKVVASAITERISKTVFSESIRQTEGLLGEVYDRADGKTTDTYQLFDMMKRIAIHVLSGVGMGASVQWHGNANEKPREGYQLTYIEACKRVISAVAGPIILPIWLMEYWPRFLPGHEFLNALAPAVVEFPIHTKHLLDEERKRTSMYGAETKNNIMSQLLEASEKEDGKALSEEEMMGDLFIFTAAGFDTTANTLSYALILLCRYPEWQDWLLEEVDSILPEDSGESVDYVATFPRAVRIMAFMLETLRLFTPLIHLGRDTKTAQTVETSHGTYHFPADCLVYVDTIALHLNADVWRDLNQISDKSLDSNDEKPDEFVFRPTRWVNPPDSKSTLFQPPKGTYVPWSAGPRVCPGQKMAQVEFTAIFLTLFRRHRIEATRLTVDEKEETTSQVHARLDAQMRDSISILTLQMQGVYDVSDGAGGSNGLGVRFSKRK